MIRVLSTATIRPRERFSFWAEETMTNGGWCFVPADRSAGAFHADVDASPLGDSILLRQSAAAYGIDFGAREIARTRDAHVLIVRHRSGVVRYGHECGEFFARRDDLVMVDLTRPNSADIVRGECQTLSVRLPHAVIAASLVDNEVPAVAKLAGPLTGLVRSYLDAVEALPFETQVAHGQAFADHVGRLLGMSLGEKRPVLADKDPRDAEAVGSARLVAITRFINARVSDPELRPAEIAAHFGISPRYLHKLFSASGETVRDYIIQRRLELCRAALSDASLAHISISEIAIDGGFESFSHFSRRFRQAFGMSPRDYRKTHAG